MNAPFPRPSSNNCPACHTGRMKVFFSADNVPTNSCILWDSEQEARSCLTGDIRLGVCTSCAFVANTAFDPARTEYSGRYEETQAFSETFNKFNRELADSIVARHSLYNKSVVEVGCGKGEFLALLCSSGNNRGLGIDPGVDRNRLEGAGDAEIEVIADFFQPEMLPESPDLIACKMTLEHISDPLTFIRQLRAGIKNEDTVLFLQVPDATRIFENCALEDVYYEHCNYFTPHSLVALAERCGFEPVHVETTYGDQYLTLEAKPVPYTEDHGKLAFPITFLKQLDTFVAEAEEFCSYWQDAVDGWADKDMKIAIWGSGSKAVSFLSNLENADAVGQVVDINPHRHGHFMPLSGQRIVSPGELTTSPPDVVIVMNRIYRDEIKAELDTLGLSPLIRCL